VSNAINVRTTNACTTKACASKACASNVYKLCKCVSSAHVNVRAARKGTTTDPCGGRRRRRAGRAAAHNGTAPTQEARAPGTSQDNTVDITLQKWTIGQARADISRNFSTLLTHLHVRYSYIFIVCTRCSHTPCLYTPCLHRH